MSFQPTNAALPLHYSAGMAPALPHDEWVFPMKCPRCRENSGYPLNAQTMKEHGSVYVSVQCRDCHHEWEAMLLATQRSSPAASD